MSDDAPETLHPETLAVHGGQRPDPATGAVVPPIHPATTFVRNDDGQPRAGWTYARSGNPTREALEAALTALQPGAGACAAFASGSAAAAAVMRIVEPGGHVLLPLDMYHGIRTLLQGEHRRWGLTVAFVDMADAGAVQEALTDGASLVWIETPSNPRLLLTDVRAVAEAAHAAGARVAVDATWTPPPLQDPFALNADLVVHATTKYLAGHSDVVGGAVLARSEEDAAFARVRWLQRHEGAVPSPFDAWLTLRGLRTLALRMRAACAGAERIAAFLAEHDAVLEVHHPSLATHPQHELARAQMTSFGAMLSVRVRGGAEAAARVASATRLFTRATSLGGVESLIEHRAPVEGPDTATPPDLLRISVGIEHPDDLIRDLARALGRVDG
ncbi:MAG: PLP-dependent transferase [Trueperaceae bacterium]|nr:PLP-dependent transferase [Trueperaceae bacterium]